MPVGRANIRNCHYPALCLYQPEITHATPFSLVLRKEYFTVRRETLTQYITFKRGGVCTLVLCSLATVTSCTDLSVRIVTISPKVGPLLTVYSPSLWYQLIWKLGKGGGGEGGVGVFLSTCDSGSSSSVTQTAQ